MVDGPETRPRFVWTTAAPSLAVSLVLMSVAVCAAVVLYVNRRASEQALDKAMDSMKSLEEVQRQVALLQDFLKRAEPQTRYFVDPAVLSPRDRDRYETLQRLERRKMNPTNTALLESYRRVLLWSYLLPLGIHPAEEELELRSQAEQIVNDRRNLDLIADSDAMQRDADQLLEEARQESRDLSIRTTWVLVLLGVCGAAAGALAGVGVAHGLQRQLLQLTIPVRTAAGTLNEVVGPIEVDSRIEVPQLQSSLDSLAAQIETVVVRLQAAERQSLRNDQLAALGQLAAGLAHELRNPLTAIRTLVESAREQQPPGQLDPRDLEVIDEELQRLDRTLQAFLDYARPPRAEHTVFNLGAVVQRTVQFLASRAQQQSIELVADVPASPVTVWADPEQMRQVLLNLVLNAFDAIGTQGRVVVRLRSTAALGAVELQVIDDGPGIPESVRERLFEPFVSTKPAGTGLGLTISRRIVESHDGRLTAAPGQPRGTVFTITLPPRRPKTGEAA